MTQLLSLQGSVRIVEVGLRDGLQSVPDIVPTAAKVELVEALAESGVCEIEVASFAHPTVLPQMADAAELLAKVPRPPGVRFRALVPNLRGAQRAAECELDTWVALVSCDDAVSRINQGRPQSEVLAELEVIGELAREAGVELVVGLAMSFFAPCSGDTAPEVRRRLVAAAVDAGATGLYFADTVGMAYPRQIQQALTEGHQAHPDLQFGLHLHTRNGFALANALVALMCNVDWLESAFCGIGGDLWFPGSPDVLGNVATEDLIAFADALDVRTGIKSTAYRRVSALAARATNREPLDHMTRGGSRDELAAANWDDILVNFEGATTARK